MESEAETAARLARAEERRNNRHSWPTRKLTLEQWKLESLFNWPLESPMGYDIRILDDRNER